MIGVIQWAISLERLDANAAVMALVSFRAEPIQSNLYSCKRFSSYLAKFKWATIRIRTEEPDLSSVPTTVCDWEE